jgi:hypothetical protein
MWCLILENMTLLCNKNRMDPIFVCRAIQYLANSSDCVNTRLTRLINNININYYYYIN